MATNLTPWVRNLDGDTGPLIMLGLFQAGSDQEIKKGEILKLSTTYFEPIEADEALGAVMAVANEEIKTGDRAGYYEVIVPRPGDVFRFELAAAAAIAIGDQYGYSTSQKVASGASNKHLTAVGQENYPVKQGHLSDGEIHDAGTTVRSIGYGLFTWVLADSYYAALVK